MTRHFCDLCDKPTLEFKAEVETKRAVVKPQGGAKFFCLTARGTLQGHAFGDICRPCFISMLNELAKTLGGRKRP